MSLMKTEDWDIGKVKPYPNNPRQNKNAVKAVAQSIKEFGWRQPIVVDKDGVIIVGHTRYEAAIYLGFPKVPVHVASNLSESQVRAYRLADNRVGELATWDDDKLYLELSALVGEDNSDPFDMAGFGFSADEMGLLASESSEDIRYLEDFEVMPQPKPKWILISALEDDCAQIMTVVKGLKFSGPMRMEYSGAPGKHPVHKVE